MMNKISGKFSLWFCLIIYWLLVVIGLLASLKVVNGHFGYPLDDTYIHMALAKHVINDGFWGVTQNGFSSSTSSPLWTVLIAITYQVFGVNDWSPLILSTLFGSLMIVYVYRLLHNSKNTLRMLLLLLIILFVPLPIMTLTGMEHILHMFLSLGLIYLAAKYLAQTRFHFGPFAFLVLLANLTTITRYEGMLLVLSISLLFLFKRRLVEGILFAITSLVSITVYGLISLAHGWYFLPNSILLKGNTPSATFAGMFNFLWRTANNYFNSPHVIVLLIGSLILYLWIKNRLDEKEKLLVILVTLTAFAHLLIAGTGWFFRYEAYLVLLLCVISADIFGKYVYPQLANLKRENLTEPGIRLALLFLFVVPLAARTMFAFVEYPTAVKNIYEQQYQMGLFIKQYYDGKCIAANDIGAINYLADVCTVDLFGLASMEVVKYKRDHSFDKYAIGKLVSDYDVQVIVIYKDWFPGQIPEGWTEAGRWKISNNVVCGGDEVSFYAPNDLLRKDLTDHLIDFSRTLPADVSQSGMYLSP